MNHYRWFRAGDLNAFFALMFDNVANLVILAGTLIGVFHLPKDIVLCIEWCREPRLGR